MMQYSHPDGGSVQLMSFGVGRASLMMFCSCIQLLLSGLHCTINEISLDHISLAIIIMYTVV